MSLSYEYDKHDRRDILRHAKALEGYVVGDVYELEVLGKHRDNLLLYYAEKCIQGWTDEDGTSHKGDKGRIGFLVQEVYFDEPRDNKAQADLGAVGVELKVSPLIYKTTRKTIDKAEFARTTFAMLGITSEQGEDFVFYGVRFWSLPQEDEPIIHKGWEDIRDIIRDGVEFVKDQKDDGTLILTKRGKSRMLNNFPDTRNTNPKHKEYRLCKSPKEYNKIISIRPHASLVYYDLKSIGYTDTENSRSNGSELPNGDIMTKQCFWFNNEYILEQIQDMFAE